MSEEVEAEAEDMPQGRGIILDMDKQEARNVLYSGGMEEKEVKQKPIRPQLTFTTQELMGRQEQNLWDIPVKEAMEGRGDTVHSL